MEELTEGRYFKTPDAIERYLIQMIEDYFSRTDYSAPGSRENIINESVKRLKDEVDFDNVGVLSVTLPGDAEPRVGNVQISLEELGGEPLIMPKRSAFNVDFGTIANTACEGDDPRLSDDRRPLPHTHEISDINGLSLEISNINNRITNISGYSHEHWNKDLIDRLIYTGTDQVSDIDISLLGGFNGSIYQELINELREYILECKTTMLEDINDFETQVTTWVIQKYNELVERLTGMVAENQKYTDVYVDEYFIALRKEINEVLEQCILKTEFAQLADMAKDKCIVVGMTVKTIAEIFSSYFASSTMDEVTEVNINVSESVNASIINALTKNDALNNYTVEAYLVYADGRETELPYMYFVGDAVGSLIVTSDIANKKVNYVISGRTRKIPGELGSASVKLVYTCKEDLSQYANTSGS